MAESISAALPQFAALARPNVHFNNVHTVTEKLKKLVEGGKNALQVIADFDRTLTKDTKETLSTFGIFEKCILLGSIKEQALALQEKYHPIEVNPNLTVAEKIPHMIEWWNKSEELLNGLVLDATELYNATKEADVQLREGCSDMLKTLHDNSIPVLVFSAGLGDVIDCVLRQKSLKYPNVHIVSNFFKFEGNKIAGFKGPMVHVFNKNEHAVENTSYFQEVAVRSNVLLMGDSIGDANMTEGVLHQGTVLKIGFLGHHVETYLPQYLEKFDIVLVDDQTMRVPTLILDNILSGKMQ